MAIMVSFLAHEIGTPSQFRNTASIIRTQARRLLPAIQLRKWGYMFCICMLAMAGSGAAACAQTFQNIPPLSFTMEYEGANPLPQVITVASAGDPINFSIRTADSTGGHWLSISLPARDEFGNFKTPDVATVSVKPDQALKAGTYSAQIIATSGKVTLTVPVSLAIKEPSTPFFDNLPGALTFSMMRKGSAPPQQLVQIRNAGSGTLDFTSATSTADGGSWITLPAKSGNAPYLLSVGINPNNLPGGGLTAGTFTGQVLLRTANDSVSIPVTVSVGDSVFRQLGSLSFTRAVQGANPLPQVITFASTNTPINFSVVTADSTGGKWLSVKLPAHDEFNNLNTPDSATVSVTDTGLLAGIYSAQIIAKSTDGSQSQVIPVTLNVALPSTAFFDDLPSSITFSAQAGTTTIASQPLMIRNAGAGTLDWMASTSTADSGNWLSLSSSSGTSPSSRTVNINRTNLPNKGQVAGTFVGQILLQSVGDNVTIPVVVSIGNPVFTEVNPLNFRKAYGAANPVAQTLTVGSNGASINFAISTTDSTGGKWLAISLSGRDEFGNYNTPNPVSVSVDPVPDLQPGVYTASIYISSTDGKEPLVVPVTLTIDASTPTGTPTLNPPGGTYSTTQHVSITSATNDAAIYYTTDGSTPTTSSNVYKGPITVSVSETVKAVAASPGYLLSTVGGATYNLGKAAATPAVTSNITITEATSGVTVYYTTNGSTPTSSSTKYTGSITISASEVLKFIAIGSGYNPSTVRTVSTTVQ